MGPKKKIDRDCSACRGDTALSGRSAGAAGAVSVVLPVVCCVFKKKFKRSKKTAPAVPALAKQTCNRTAAAYSSTPLTTGRCATARSLHRISHPLRLTAVSPSDTAIPPLQKLFSLTLSSIIYIL